MIYILGLEPLKERYTEWWESYIPKEFKKVTKNVSVIEGEKITDKVETGTVLDASGTNYWKTTQLQKIIKMFHNKEIEPYSIFFVTDIWFPGIEMIRYMSTLYDIPVHIWGVWHAGSSTMNDFAEPMHYWSKYFEVGFLNICDGVFVGSDYSRNSIIARLLYFLPELEVENIANKIYAYGMPLDTTKMSKYYSTKKNNIILFPHRPDEEKNPHIFINIINALSMYWDDFKDNKFIFCTSKEKYQSQSMWVNAALAELMHNHPNVIKLEDLTKDKYYKLLAKSKLVVSTTSEENFGYCAVEALSVGTKVLLPNNFSHPEIVENNQDLLYDTYDNLLEKIVRDKKIPSKELKEYVLPYGQVVRKWISIMRM